MGCNERNQPNCSCKLEVIFYSKIDRVKIVADVFLHETNFTYLKKRVNFHIPNLSLLLNSLFTVKI